MFGAATGVEQGVVTELVLGQRVHRGDAVAFIA